MSDVAALFLWLFPTSEQFVLSPPQLNPGMVWTKFYLLLVLLLVDNNFVVFIRFCLVFLKGGFSPFSFSATLINWAHTNWARTFPEFSLLLGHRSPWDRKQIMIGDWVDSHPGSGTLPRVEKDLWPQTKVFEFDELKLNWLFNKNLGLFVLPCGTVPLFYNTTLRIVEVMLQLNKRLWI